MLVNKVSLLHTATWFLDENLRRNQLNFIKLNLIELTTFPFVTQLKDYQRTRIHHMDQVSTKTSSKEADYYEVPISICFGARVNLLRH